MAQEDKSLQSKRIQVLAKIPDNWDTMSEQEQEDWCQQFIDSLNEESSSAD